MTKRHLDDETHVDGHDRGLVFNLRRTVKRRNGLVALGLAWVVGIAV